MESQRFIVKVQVSLYPNNGSVLVYNQDRSIYHEEFRVPVNLVGLMNGRPKAYFWASLHRGKLRDHPWKAGTELELHEEAPEQEW